MTIFLHFINENGKEKKDLKTPLKRFTTFIRLNKPKTKVGDGNGMRRLGKRYKSFSCPKEQ